MSKQTKQLGGWGLVVALVGSVLGMVIPFSVILVLAGWIAVLIAYFKASDELGEPEIKNSTLKAIIAGVIGIIVFIVGGGTMMLGMISAMREGGSMHFGGTGFLVMIVAWILFLAASWFWYKANSFLSEKTGVGLFKTGGLLMFIGTVLTIIMIGGLVSLIGEILLIVAWFSVKEAQE